MWDGISGEQVSDIMCTSLYPFIIWNLGHNWLASRQPWRQAFLIPSILCTTGNCCAEHEKNNVTDMEVCSQRKTEKSYIVSFFAFFVLLMASWRSFKELLIICLMDNRCYQKSGIYMDQEANTLHSLSSTFRPHPVITQSQGANCKQTFICWVN